MLFERLPVRNAFPFRGGVMRLRCLRERDVRLQELLAPKQKKSRRFVALRHLSRAAGEVGRGSGREEQRRNLRRDTDIRFTLSLA